MAPSTRIVLRDLTFHAAIDADSWGRPAKPTQPVRLSLAVTAPLTLGPAAEAQLDIDYSRLAALVLNEARRAAALQVLVFHAQLAAAIHTAWPIVTHVAITTTLPISVHSADAQAVWSSRLTCPFEVNKHAATLVLAPVRASTVIGLRDHEATAAQTVLTSLRLAISFPPRPQDGFPLGTAHALAARVVATVQAARVGTVEALWRLVRDDLASSARVDGDAQAPLLSLPELTAHLVWLRLEKTDALQFVGGASVEMEWEDPMAR